HVEGDPGRIYRALEGRFARIPGRILGRGGDIEGVRRELRVVEHRIDVRARSARLVDHGDGVDLRVPEVLPDHLHRGLLGGSHLEVDRVWQRVACGRRRGGLAGEREADGKGKAGGPGAGAWHRNGVH